VQGQGHELAWPFFLPLFTGVRGWNSANFRFAAFCEVRQDIFVSIPYRGCA
jgi:hypothetical protein